MHSFANFWAKLGNYAVLSRISILADLRVFCANFGSEKCACAIFYAFSMSAYDTAIVIIY